MKLIQFWEGEPDSSLACASARGLLPKSTHTIPGSVLEEPKMNLIYFLDASQKILFLFMKRADLK